MTRWEVIFRVGAERRKHIVKADDEAAAGALAIRPYPGATFIDAREIGPAIVESKREVAA